MFPSKVITRILIPGAAIVSSRNPDKHEKFCRPSELPIYSPEPSTAKQTSESTEPGLIENYFAVARQTIFTAVAKLSSFQKVAEENVQLGMENADSFIKYLGEEDNVAPKAGAIAVGALTGYIFALRGGTFKRVLYSTVGALGMASVCYPKQASEYSKIAVTEGKKLVTIGYNFVYGDPNAEVKVKRDPCAKEPAAALPIEPESKST